MSQQLTAQQVKEAARDFGADLVGIASIEALRYLPAEINPLSIHSGAKTVIVIGRKILRGALRGIEQGKDVQNSYPTYGLYAWRCYPRKITYESHSGLKRMALKPYHSSATTPPASPSVSLWHPASRHQTSSCSIAW